MVGRLHLTTFVTRWNDRVLKPSDRAKATLGSSLSSPSRSRKLPRGPVQEREHARLRLRALILGLATLGVPPEA